jgi:hypothetical protein
MRKRSSKRTTIRQGGLRWPLLLVVGIVGTREALRMSSTVNTAHLEPPSYSGASRLPTPLPPFRYSAVGSDVRIFADVEQPVVALLPFAQSVLRILRRRLCPTEQRSDRIYTVYLCDDIETVERLAYGLSRLDTTSRTFKFRGGFFPDAGMIGLQCDPHEDMRPTIAHELTHAVFRESVGTSCDAIDEGLAMYTEAWVAGQYQGPYNVTSIATGLEGGSLPSLSGLFFLDYWQFRDERADNLNYELSLLLARVLLEDSSPDITGRMPELLRNLRAYPPFGALQQTYDIDILERAWRARIEEHSRWIPIYGTWGQRGASFDLTLRQKGTATIVSRQRPRLGEPYSIRARARSGLGAPRGIGFVLALEDASHYVTAILWPDADAFSVYKREGEEWTLLYEETSPLPVAWMEKDLQLHCDEQGKVQLSLGSRILARFNLGALAFAGRAGLYVDPDIANENGVRRVLYDYIVFDGTR